MSGPSTPKPLSFQPQPLIASITPLCSTTPASPAAPMRYIGDPKLSTESLNCALTESLFIELPCARMRIHRWYGMPAVAVNVTSKYVAGAANAGEIFDFPLSGFQSALPPAAVGSLTTCQAPPMC